jgi:hypothetical protein
MSDAMLVVTTMSCCISCIPDLNVTRLEMQSPLLHKAPIGV